MTPMVIGGLFEVAKGLIGLADQAIEDKDKKIEFQYRVLDRTLGFYEKMMEQKTIPWVDALVKFVMVFKEFVRPIGSFILTAAAAYMSYKGIALPDWVEVVMYGAFPGWMASRHSEKKNKTWIDPDTGKPWK